jgi:hypothetical protein
LTRPTPVNVDGVEKKHSEKRTRLVPAQGNLAATVPPLKRSQDPELDLAGLPAWRR